MILILDYGLGNLTSVYRAFKRIGSNVKVSNNQSDILKADKIILPGVGHFVRGMEQINSNGFIDELNTFVIEKERPILGICLGMQLMTNFSEEGNVKGLSWINGETKKISTELRIPHIGWNTLDFKNDSNLFKTNDSTKQYYFVHSYSVQLKQEKEIIATSTYGESFVSVFQKNNIFGTQFHPEKSHEQGSNILKEFVNF